MSSSARSGTWRKMLDVRLNGVKGRFELAATLRVARTRKERGFSPGILGWVLLHRPNARLMSTFLFSFATGTKYRPVPRHCILLRVNSQTHCVQVSHATYTYLTTNIPGPGIQIEHGDTVLGFMFPVARTNSPMQYKSEKLFLPHSYNTAAPVAIGRRIEEAPSAMF